MTGLRDAELEVFPNPEALAHRVADWLLGVVRSKDDVVAIALSGGATPQRLYRLLAGPSYRDAFPWPRVHWFWGDERFVPPDDPQSNYRMVWEAMLSRSPVPAANIHRVPTVGIGVEAAALAYEHELKSFYGADRLDPARPLFGATLLGLGPDGHTASLFPGTPVLDERERWVAPVADAQGQPRITLTYPVLESSGNVAFLVEGSEKRAILARIRQGGGDSLPAACLNPSGKLWLFTDTTAA